MWKDVQEFHSNPSPIYNQQHQDEGRDVKKTDMAKYCDVVVMTKIE